MKSRLEKAVCLRTVQCWGVQALMAGTLFVFAGIALADKYTWSNASGGSFDVLSNWTVGGSPVSAVPSTGDKIVNFTAGEYTVALGGDTTVDTFLLDNGYNASDCRVTLDMGGSTFTVTNYLTVAGIYGKGIPELTLTNGTLTCLTAYGDYTNLKGISVDGYSTANRTGRLIIRGPQTQVNGLGKILIAGNQSQFQLLEGASFYTTGTLFASATNGYLRIAGAGTHLESGDTFMLYDGDSQFARIEDQATVLCNGLAIGSWGDFCTLWMDNASLTNTPSDSNHYVSIGRAATGSSLVVTNNATLHPMQNIYVGDSYNEATHSSTCSLVVADGGSVVLPSDKSIEVGRCYAIGTVLEVNGGNVNAPFIRVGGYSSPAGTSSNNVLRVAGADASIVVTAKHYTDGHGLTVRYGGRIEFTIPGEGFSQTPVQLTQGAFTTARSSIAGYEDVPNRIVVNAEDWARRHPGETITLMQCARDSSAGFAELLANATFPVVNPDRACTLSVSVDHKSLLLTSPRERGTVMIVN